MKQFVPTTFAIFFVTVVLLCNSLVSVMSNLIMIFLHGSRAIARVF